MISDETILSEITRARESIMGAELRLRSMLRGECPMSVECERCPGYNVQARICMLVAIRNWTKKDGEGWSP
jgi:hypothetical protein